MSHRFSNFQKKDKELFTSFLPFSSGNRPGVIFVSFTVVGRCWMSAAVVGGLSGEPAVGCG